MLVLTLVLALPMAKPTIGSTYLGISLDLSASPTEVCEGETTQLTVTLKNEETWYTLASIESLSVLGYPLQPVPGVHNWSSTGGDSDGLLEPGETWTWQVETEALYATTQFDIAGVGLVCAGFHWYGSASVEVTVIPCAPPVECGPCEGGVTSLTLQYNGAGSSDVVVKAKKKDVILFDDTVGPGEMFTVIGADKHGKLGPEIKIFVDGEKYTKIHTSCSQPIGIGMVFGDFEIVGGESLKGGALCPIVE